MTPQQRSTIVWFRRDLRLANNDAVREACAAGRPVVFAFVLESGRRPQESPGAASRWWLHHSLRELSRALSARGSSLTLLRGDPKTEIAGLANAVNAAEVVVNPGVGPADQTSQDGTEQSLRADGRALRVTEKPGYLSLMNSSKTPYRVFTAFWKSHQQMPAEVDPWNPPPLFLAPTKPPSSLSLDALELLPNHAWTDGLAASWVPGEAAAKKRFEDFMEGAISGYETQRDLPATVGTSHLSPHLAFGEIDSRAMIQRLVAASNRSGKAGPGFAASCAAFHRQLVWRNFAAYLIEYFPQTIDAPLRPEFNSFPWERDCGLLRAWQHGKTGYPLVDAGMRELWQTGWMHGRVRMSAASLLTKHLLQPWTDGLSWFNDTLVDADLGNNTFGWQWAAGCGADAAPYFRVFNPSLQGERFDPQGAYVRRWLPELARLPDRYIHRPFDAPPDELARAGVVLGKTYPLPIIEHREGRMRALRAFDRLRAKKGSSSSHKASTP